MKMIAASRSAAQLLCLTCLFCTIQSSAQRRRGGESQATTQPGTLWSDDKLLDTVNAVSMGPTLLPKSWPNHARVAVLITFDDDTQAPAPTRRDHRTHRTLRL